MNTRLATLAALLIVPLMLVACGGGSGGSSDGAEGGSPADNDGSGTGGGVDNGSGSPAGDPAGGDGTGSGGDATGGDDAGDGGTPVSGGESPADDGIPDGLRPIAGATIPATLNQRFACTAGSTDFSLSVLNTGVAEYLDQQGGSATGDYAIEQGRLVVRLSTGDVATSTEHVVAGTLILGASFESLDGTISNCVARDHSSGDRIDQDVAVRCGTRNVTGSEENTFTLFASGSSTWENRFEIPGDTLFETRIGTFLFDAPSSSVLMVYRAFSGNELLYFGGLATTESFTMAIAPEEGSGSFTPREECRYL